MKILAGIFFLTLLLSGCTTNVTVVGSIPTPLVARIPANVGVYYDENFKNFVHTEALREVGADANIVGGRFGQVALAID